MKLFSFTICNIMLFSSLAYGQSSRINIGDQIEKSDQVVREGAVDVLVNEKGLGKAKAEVILDGKVHKTDDIGFLTVDLPEGNHHIDINIGQGSQSVDFVIVGGERTQLIFNLLSDDIERLEPAKKISQKNVDKSLFGKIKGQIKSVKGEAVSGVRVYVKSSDISTTTNGAGVYELNLPPGNHVLSFSHPKFSTEIAKDIEVKPKSEASKNLEMTPTGLVLEDFVVLAPRMRGSIEALIEVRRNSSNVADVMSAEQISKSGDSDAGSSLRRVTGLTLVDGKYVYVRGLGERYSSTLMNGISLPSPDPMKRVVPLDLFPTHILESLTIQKSYSSNMPGEFGGGTVVLNTKTVPEKFFLKAKIGQSIHTGATRIKSTVGGSSDWFGLDDGARAMPADIQRGRGDLNQFLQRNRHGIEEANQETIPEFAFAFGDRWKARKFKTGYALSMAFSDGAEGRVENRNKYRENSETGALEVDAFDSREKIERTRNLSGILGLQLKAFKSQEITANYVVLRQTTDYVATAFGEDEESIPFRQTDREWAENEVRMLSLQGEHEIPGVNFLKLGWHFADSKARRYEPDKIVDEYVRNDDGTYSFRNVETEPRYLRRFFDLLDNGRDVALTLTSELPWFYGRKGEVNVGVGSVEKRRQSSMRRFEVEPNRDVISASSKLDPNQDLDTIFTNCPECFQVKDSTQPTDQYRASQEISNYFFATKIPLLSSLDMTAGARFEESVQQVASIRTFGGVTESFLENRDWLPSTSLTWRFAKKMQLRFAQSETVSRPDFKELSATRWRDFDLDEDVQGNPSVRSAVIKSYDLRWEYYYARRGNVSVGVFYKEFINPIESIFTQGSDPRITFVNATGATNYGVELEAAVPAGPFTFSGNIALIDSQISLNNVTADLASKERPLQGQSPYTANLLVDYNNEVYDLNASLAYNIYGPRIVLLDPNSLPNIVENPFNQLDFVFSKRLTKDLSLGAKIRNILNPTLRFTQGGRVWREFKRGQALSLSLTMEI